MKRVLCMAMVLILALSMTVCLAEAGSGEMKDLSGITVPNFSSVDDVPKKKSDADKGSVTTDTVTINGNEYKVVTPDGISLSFTATENSFALTQDLLQQADLYVLVYQSPVEVVNYFIENYTHLDIYDFQKDVDIYVHIFDTGLAKLYPDSARLSDEEANYLLGFMKESPEYFQGATETACGWIGKNVWFLGDLREKSGYVHLACFVNGKEIFACAKVSTDEQYDCMLELLENLVIEAA